MKGTVKFFNNMKHFGFIKADDGNEYFVHQSDVGQGIELAEDMAVEFEVVDGDRGKKAANVKIVTGSDDSDSEDNEDDEE